MSEKEIWRPGTVKLFISHLDTSKSEANELADALEPYGISSFVAHDTIQPMTQWMSEILKGLAAMDVMLAFVTKNFHKSPWVNQEVGYALGRGIPVLPLKLQQEDPPGFIGDRQALKGSLDAPAKSALDICHLVDAELGHSRWIGAFVASRDFSETIDRFNRMNEIVERLSDDEVKQLRDGFAANSQLYDCAYLDNPTNHRLRDFLERTTGKEYSFGGKRITEIPS